MAEISKQALKVDNNQSFPNNNNGAITPSILRAFNVNMIDSMVDEIGYTADSSSWNQQIDALEQFTASASGLTTGSLLVTASASGNVITFTKGDTSTFNVTVATGSAGGDTTQLNQATASLQAFTQSANIRLTNLESTTASLNISISNLNASSASQQVSINALNVFTASQSTASLVTSITELNSFSASAKVSINALNSATASYVTETESGSFLITASFDNGTRNLTFTKGDTTTFAVNIPDVSGSAGNFVTTSSFNAYTSSNDQRVSSLETATASLFTSASLAIVTASVTNDDITFTKGDGSTFTIQVATGSFALSASYAESASYAQFAQDIYLNVKNTTGAQLNKGTVVRIIGAVGDNALVATASWEDDDNSANTLGFLYENIANDAFGKVVTQGTLLGINTDPVLGYTAGQILYLSSSGQYTNVIPPAPYHEVRLGQVLRAQQNNGSIYILIQNGYELSELHDVDINTGSLATNNLLAYNSASGQWENKTLTQVGATTTSSFNSYTSSNDQRVSSLEAATGSYATTGSNTFTGDQTLIDAGGNTITLSDTSGSLMLVAKGFTSASAHLSSSAANKVNIIFKDNNNTTTTYISGSNNIFTNSQAASAGFRKQLGSSNINLFNVLPDVSASMGDYVAIDNNFITSRTAAPMSIRGPISSSQWEVRGNTLLSSVSIGTSATNNAEKIVSGLLFIQNQVGSVVSVIANRNTLTQQSRIGNNSFLGGITLNMASSSIDYTNNINIGGAVVVRSESSGSASTNLNNVISIDSNLIGGNTTIVVSGSDDPNDAADTDYLGSVVRSVIYGSGINVKVNTGFTGSNTLAGTAIIGNSLTVSGSSRNPVTNAGTNLGSAFFGRFNALDGNKALTAQTIFAVGTGTATAAASRKTGFLIDSGSNTFVEGTFNVSGSSTFTGSVNITGSISVNGSPIAGIATGSFATTGSNQFNGNQTITGSLTMTGSILFVDRSNSDSNIYLGTNALGMGTAGASPLALGNTQAIAIGQGAMRFASGSSQNIALGNNALAINSGSKNFAMGGESMTNNTTGTSNVAIGVNTLNLNVSSNDNVAIGSNALQNAMSAQNTGIGAETIKNAKSNSAANTALGKGALQNHYDGDTNTGQNMAFGLDAMANMTSGSANTAIGAAALRDPGRANENVFIGWIAGYNASGSVDQNVVIGARAASVLTNSSNTIIGHNAAAELRNGARNIFIGQGIGGNIITGSNNTLIGNIGGVDNWQSVIAIGNGITNSIKFFNSGSKTTLTNDTLISGSLTTTGSATIGKVLELTQLNPLPTGADGQLAVSASNLYFFSGSAWNRVAFA